MNLLAEKMKSFYNSSERYQEVLSNCDHYRRDFALDRYVSFVLGHVPTNGLILDLGCGMGETSRRFRDKGRDVIGCDISFKLLKAGRAAEDARHIPSVVADICHLPFRNRSVSIITINDVIEHIPSVEKMLDEFLRVIRPDGRIVIVSPNLLCPIKPLRHLAGVEGFNVKFYGSRMRAFLTVFGNVALNLGKIVSPKPRFKYREPILDDFRCPDDDAVYLSNFIDLTKWFRARNWTAQYEPLVSNTTEIVGKLKLMILRMFPWFDKGFCMVARENSSEALTRKQCLTANVDVRSER